MRTPEKIIEDIIASQGHNTFWVSEVTNKIPIFEENISKIKLSHRINNSIDWIDFVDENFSPKEIDVYVKPYLKEPFIWCFSNEYRFVALHSRYNFNCNHYFYKYIYNGSLSYLDKLPIEERTKNINIIEKCFKRYNWNEASEKINSKIINRYPELKLSML